MLFLYIIYIKLYKNYNNLLFYKRACKGDDPEDMIARRILGKWNIVKGDLL